MPSQDLACLLIIKQNNRPEEGELHSTFRESVLVILAVLNNPLLIRALLY